MIDKFLYPFIIYADFESHCKSLIHVNQTPKNLSVNQIQKHSPKNVRCYTKYEAPKYSKLIYTGEDMAEKFMEYLKSEDIKYISCKKKINKQKQNYYDAAIWLLSCINHLLTRQTIKIEVTVI